MEVSNWNQVALNLVNHLAGHPELALVALTELIRNLGRLRKGSGEASGWTLDAIKGLKGAGAGVVSIVILKLIMGGGFPFLGMLTYLIRTV